MSVLKCPLSFNSPNPTQISTSQQNITFVMLSVHHYVSHGHISGLRAIPYGCLFSATKERTGVPPHANLKHVTDKQ